MGVRPGSLNLGGALFQPVAADGFATSTGERESGAFHQVDQKQQDHGAHRGRDDRPDQTAAGAEAQKSEQVAADDGTDDATTMSPSSPNPPPRISRPASQPATAPIARKINQPGIAMDLAPLG